MGIEKKFPTSPSKLTPKIFVSFCVSTPNWFV